MRGTLESSPSAVGYSETSPLLTNEKECKTRQLNLFETVSSIVNCFVGICLLSMPYAFSKAKWFSPFCLLAVTTLAYFTSYALCLASNMTNTTVYSDIGLRAIGKKGQFFVRICVGLQFVTIPMMFLIFVWRNSFFLFELHYLTLCFIMTALVTPLTWFLTYGEMAFLNTIGVITAVFFAFETFYCFFFLKHAPREPETSSFADMAMGVGIMILGQADHACVPNIYRDMKNKEQFPTALLLSFVSIYIIYCTVGLAGWLSFGDATDIICTENMKYHPGGLLFYVATGIIVINTFVSVPPFLSVISELFEDYFGIRKSSGKRVFRSCLLWFLALGAYFLTNYLNYVEAITGSFPACLAAFVLPPLFLFYSQNKVVNSKNSGVFQGNAKSYGLWFCIIMGLVFGVGFTIIDFLRLGGYMGD